MFQRAKRATAFVGCQALDKGWGGSGEVMQQPQLLLLLLLMSSVCLVADDRPVGCRCLAAAASKQHAARRREACCGRGCVQLSASSSPTAASARNTHLLVGASCLLYTV
jgi:hypothetical protein